MNDIYSALWLMLYGVCGVFAVLLIFYVMTVILKAVFPYKENKESKETESAEIPSKTNNQE